MSAAPQLACREMVELVTDYLEGALPGRDARRFEEHLSGCPGCREYLEQIRTTVRLTGTLREESVPDDIREHLLHAFRDWNGPAPG